MEDVEITVIGGGPYGLSASAYLRDAGMDVRTFGEPMSFWERQMPQGMCLRSSWDASHIADPKQALTIDAFCRETGSRCPKPIPLDQFVRYGQWFQQKVVPDIDRRQVKSVERNGKGFKITLSDAQRFTSKRVAVATGIGSFAQRPREFEGIPSSLASHSSELRDPGKFKGKSVAVIGAGQSAVESAVLLREAGAEVEVIARQPGLRWVGLHPKLHHLGLLSRVLYSKRDVGPAGISRLVAAPHVFRRFPRWFKDRTAYRAIRPAVAGWIKPRIGDLAFTFGLRIIACDMQGDRLCLKFDNGTNRFVDHALLATGFRINVSQYDFLSPSLVQSIRTANGYPVLRRGMVSSVPGLHFLGKTGAWSFGPLVGFVSGTEFASSELTHYLTEHRDRED